MHPGLTIGNAATDGAPFRQWFVGDLRAWASAPGEAEGSFGLRDTDAVAVKWGVHAAGDRRPGGWVPGGGTTLGLLASGAFVLCFREPGSPAPPVEVRLAAPGDYVIWGSRWEHTWRAEQDSAMVTVRWRAQPPEGPLRAGTGGPHGPPAP